MTTVKNKTTVTASTNSVTISGADGIAENTDQSYQVNVASGATVVIPNITVTDSDGTTSSVPSVQDVTCTPSPDATVQLNGSTIGTIASGATGDFPVTQDGSAVGSWDGIAWIIPPATSGDTLTIGVFSDIGLTNPITSADFGDTIYINLQTTITTPTEYRFMVSGRSSSIEFDFTSQGTATLNYTVAGFNDIFIYAEARNATDVAAALNVFEVTLNADVDANAYIAAHNALSLENMAGVQQQFVQGLYQRLKGFNTLNQSDLLTYFRTNAACRFLPLVPVNNTTVNTDAYLLDAIHLNTGSRYFGMIPSDITVRGVFGGTGKYMLLDVSSSDFPQNNIAVSTRIRTEGEMGLACAFGASNVNTENNSISLLTRRSGDQSRLFVNSSTRHAIYFPTKTGSYIGNRNNATSQSLLKDGVTYLDLSNNSNAPSTIDMCFHAMNINGSIGPNYNGELSFYAMTLGMDAQQSADFESIIIWIQNNVITGGR